MEMRILTTILLALGLAFGGSISCRDDDDDRDGSGDGADGGNGNGSGNGTDGKLDPESCRFVDVVIAVDGSGSMKEELGAMRDVVFPAFAQQLGDIADGLDDFRVATLDSCLSPANFHTRGVGGECNFEGGNAWINNSSSAMNQEFACVGDIYLADGNCTGNDDDEQPATAVVTALSDPWGSNENAGFLREEALLVVIAITDEDEQSTTYTNTQQIYDELIALKGGDAEKIVFLGVGGSQQCKGAYGEASPATVLMQLTDMFKATNRGVWWDLCQGSLEDGLGEAFDIIEMACEEFSIPVV